MCIRDSSYASQFGGVCTLIGTSTNLLVNSIAVKAGLPPFSMFEFAQLGLLLYPDTDALALLASKVSEVLLPPG